MRDLALANHRDGVAFVLELARFVLLTGLIHGPLPAESITRWFVVVLIRELASAVGTTQGLMVLVGSDARVVAFVVGDIRQVVDLV